MKNKEANLISFKVLVTADGKLITELSQFPIEKINKTFALEDRQVIKTLVQRAKVKLEPLHVELQKELDALQVII